MLPNLKVFLFICVFIIVSKNFLRISQSVSKSTNGIWPDIYSETNDYKINNFKKIKKNNKHLYYYSEGKLYVQ